MEQHGISKLDLKRRNRMQVLKILKQRGPTSRIDIAGTLELTRAAVTIITNEMIEQGIIQEIGEYKHITEKAPRGRKKILIDINHHYKFVIGVTLEEDIVSVGLSTLAGAVLDKRNLEVNESTPYDTIEEFILDSVKEILSDHYKIVIPICVNEVLHLVHKGPLPLVRDAPLQKIPLLEFLQYIFVRLVREIARHAGTVAQLDLPAAHVGVDAQSFVRQKRCAKSINGDFSAAGCALSPGCDLTSELIDLVKINEVRQFPAVHAAEDAVLCKDIVQQNIEFFAVLQDLPR